MACNENVIKNMANEVTRNCQTHNVNVDPEFVTYLIDLLLLNPKYGKLFAKTINRNNLAYFVDECVNVLIHKGTQLSTLKIQFILQKNYDQLELLIKKHLDSRLKRWQPIYEEILNDDPKPSNTLAFEKLFRKISIYIVLISDLGNPKYVIALREGLAAVESVFSLEDLKMFVGLPRPEKIMLLDDLIATVSGVRLFNRNCERGGEGIPDLTGNLVDSGKACMSLLSKTLMTVMQRVKILTTAIRDIIDVQDETGNVVINTTAHDFTKQDCYEILNLVAFDRQLEVIIRKLLYDIEFMTQKSIKWVQKLKAVLEELKTAVKYKEAVPVHVVVPHFCKLWEVWREMQNAMHLVTTVRKLITILNSIQEHIKIPKDVLKKIPMVKAIQSSQSVKSYPTSSTRLSLDERLSLASLQNYIYRTSSEDTGIRFSDVSAQSMKIEFLGFCALCLSVGALVPNNSKVGLIKYENCCYAFCSVKMAVRFSKEPERYLMEVLTYVRNHPHLINLLNVLEEVEAVKDISDLVVKRVAKKKVLDKDIQTETHPIEEFKKHNYSSNLGEWKKKAIIWASIVNCQTHSTQTDYSHCRSDIQSQTITLSDKQLQTRKDSGMNTLPNNYFIWGLRGRRGTDQHMIDLCLKHSGQKLEAPTVTRCRWPCVGYVNDDVESFVSEDVHEQFFFPESRSMSSHFRFD